MEKKEVLTFSSFHLILQPYMITTQYTLYNELFQWAYPDGDVPEACVSRWCTGRAPVKDVISRFAAKQPEEEFSRYSNIWSNLLKLGYINCPDTLMVSLRDAIRKDVFQQKKRLPKAGHELMAWALVQSLGNDYIQNKIQIAPSLLSALQEVDKHCREANIPLRAPYILNILLKTQCSPLLQALNRLRPSLGDQYAKIVQEYVSSTDHSGTYEGWEVTQCEFLFYAQKESFLDSRKTAEEFDIVKGLLWSRSSTVEQLLKNAGGREALIEALPGRRKTTTLAITNQRSPDDKGCPTTASGQKIEP